MPDVYNGVKEIAAGGRAASARVLRGDLVAISAPDGALEEAIESAKAQLAGFGAADLDRLADVPRTVWVALGSLALGHFQVGAAALNALATQSNEVGSGSAASLFLLLAARYFAWTGDLTLLLEIWPRLRNSIDHCASSAAADAVVLDRPMLESDAFTAAALRELTITAESIGHSADATALRLAASQALEHLHRRAAYQGQPAFLLLGLAEQTLADSGPPCCSFAAWADFAAGHSESGYQRWRSCFAASHTPPMSSLDRRVGPLLSDPAQRAALAAATLVHGLLGVEPDAARQRLRVRPQLPRAWDRMQLRQLAMGDAHFTLSYRRAGIRHEFVVEQTAGAVPVRLIFEPALPARFLHAARVDGVAAQLDPRPFGERVLAPVQLGLDRPRTITFEV